MRLCSRTRGQKIPIQGAPDRRKHAPLSACQHQRSLKVLPLLQGPSKQYVLGLFPSPLHRWHPPGIPEDVEFWIKRDDLTGMQLSGNKVQEPPSCACHFGEDAIHALIVVESFSKSLLLQLRKAGIASTYECILPAGQEAGIYHSGRPCQRCRHAHHNWGHSVQPLPCHSGGSTVELPSLPIFIL